MPSDVDLQGVFIDAWSQQPWNIADEDQQEAFERETAKLWEFAKQNELFAFRTIEDVLGLNNKFSVTILSILFGNYNQYKGRPQLKKSLKFQLLAEIF